MEKLTIKDLKSIRDDNRSMLNLRKGYYKAKIIIHMGTCGIAAGARNVMTALMDEIAHAGANDILVKTGGCGGICNREPMAIVQIADKPPVAYGDLDETKIREIYISHIKGGNPLAKYAVAIGTEAIF